MINTIGLVANSTAGSAESFTESAMDYVKSRGGVAYHPKDFSELKEVIVEFKKRKVRIIAVLGGDGTNHQVLTVAQNTFNGEDPAYCFLGKGTQNVLRNTRLRLRDRDPKEQLEFLLQKGPRVVKNRLLRITNGDEQVSYGFLVGSALSSSFIDLYNANGSRKWPTIRKVFYAGLTGRGHAKQLFTPRSLELSIDGVEQDPEKYTGIIAGTINHVATGVRVLGKASEEKAHLIAVNCGRWGLINNVPNVLLGTSVKGAVYDGTFDKFELRGGRVPIMVDGDRSGVHGDYDSDYWCIERGPPIKILLPE